MLGFRVRKVVTRAFYDCMYGLRLSTAVIARELGGLVY